MGLIDNLALGFGVALALPNLAYAVGGAALGMLVGVLPGPGAVAAIAMLMPAAVALGPTSALILLAGVYCGSQVGRATAPVLIEAAGASASVVSPIDGGRMPRHGRAAPALATAGLGAFFAGCVGTFVVAVVAPPLTEIAFRFGPEEYFSLLALGLIGAVVLAPGSLVKALGMLVLGLLLGQVGPDVDSGVARYSFDVPALADGIGFIAIAIGVFGFGEIIAHLGRPPAPRVLRPRGAGGPWPTRQDWQQAWPAVLRGTALGSLLGVLPGRGARLASVVACALERRLARAGRARSEGDISGVSGPSAAGTAGVQTSFVPMLALGIPPNAVMALMVGAMTIDGMRPGPQVLTGNPELFWGLIASLWLINGMLLILALPLAGLWRRLPTVPYRFLFPAILSFSCIGLYTIHDHGADVVLAALFGLAGYGFHKLGCAPAPLLLGFILGPMMEASLRRALSLSDGDWSTFVTRPVSAGLLLAALLMLVVVSLPSLRRRREGAFEGPD